MPARGWPSVPIAHGAWRAKSSSEMWLTIAWKFSALLSWLRMICAPIFSWCFPWTHDSVSSHVKGVVGDQRVE